MKNGQRLLRLRFPSRPGQLKRVRKKVMEAVAPLNLEKSEVKLLVLAVNEACMNVIQHGYKGDPAGEIHLEILNNNRDLEFRVRDFADPVDPSNVKPRCLECLRPGGLGTHFMGEIMDDFFFRRPEGDRGNLLIMKKKLTTREEKQDAM